MTSNTCRMIHPKKEAEAINLTRDRDLNCLHKDTPLAPAQSSRSRPPVQPAPRPLESLLLLKAPPPPLRAESLPQTSPLLKRSKIQLSKPRRPCWLCSAIHPIQRAGGGPRGCAKRAALLGPRGDGALLGLRLPTCRRQRGPRRMTSLVLTGHLQAAGAWTCP